MAGEIYMKTIIDTTKIEAPVWCAVCRLEIEEEGIEIDEANIRAGYIFWSELNKTETKIIEGLGYTYDDLVGRISKNDTLAKRNEIMKLIEYRL
jgi:hypothetical protein